MRILRETTLSSFTEVYPKLYYNDFDAHHTMSDIAERIAADLRYEAKWIKIAENNDNYKKVGNR